jgi:hypothetical protein
MIHALVAFVFILASAFRHRHGLALENLALRQQLAVYQRRHPRPRLRSRDRIFPVWLSKDTTGAQALFVDISTPLGRGDKSVARG